MYKLLVFVFALAGCKAGNLHGYTAQIQSAPVIQQYVTEQHVIPQQQYVSYTAPASIVETPLVYAAPVVEKKAPAMRQRQLKKQRIEQPIPESFSYQIRVQHAEQPQQVQEVEEQTEEYAAPQYQQVQQVEQQIQPQIQEVQQIHQHVQPLVQHYEYQPIQTYQTYPTIQLQEAPELKPVQKARAQVRRPMKSARIQTQRTQIKTKNADLASPQFPQIDDFQYTYTPIVYYFQDVNAGRPVQRKPIQPQPQPEEEEEQDSELETLDRYEAQEEAADEDDDYETEIVVARIQPKQKLARSRVATQSSARLNVNGQSFDSPLLAYQSFNAGW